MKLKQRFVVGKMQGSSRGADTGEFRQPGTVSAQLGDGGLGKSVLGKTREVLQKIVGNAPTPGKSTGSCFH